MRAFPFQSVKEVKLWKTSAFPLGIGVFLFVLLSKKEKDTLINRAWAQYIPFLPIFCKKMTPWDSPRGRPLCKASYRPLQEELIFWRGNTLYFCTFLPFYIPSFLSPLCGKIAFPNSLHSAERTFLRSCKVTKLQSCKAAKLQSCKEGEPLC